MPTKFERSVSKDELRYEYIYDALVDVTNEIKKLQVYMKRRGFSTNQQDMMISGIISTLQLLRDKAYENTL